MTIIVEIKSKIREEEEEKSHWLKAAMDIIRNLYLHKYSVSKNENKNFKEDDNDGIEAAS